MDLYLYFILTLIIELPLVVLFFKNEWKKALVAGLLLNLFTWPLLHLFIFESHININLLEIALAIIEGLGYYLLLKCKWQKAFLVSFFVNALSYAIGILIR
jgi:hypothetical protein